MRLEHLSSYAEFLDQSLRGERISNLSFFTDSCFSYRTSAKSASSITFYLSSAPLVYLSDRQMRLKGVETHFAQQLRKELPSATIVSVKKPFDDAILRFELLTLDSKYDEVRRYFYIELVRGRANAVLTDEDGTIIIAMKAFPLTAERPIMRGLAYPKPSNPPFIYENEPFSLEALSKETEAISETLLNARKKSFFERDLKAIKARKRLLERKLILLAEDKKDAASHLDDARFGDFIYTNLEEIDPASRELDVYGTKVKIDPLKSLAKNAEGFYKKAKKAKAALSTIDREIQKAEEELSSLGDALLILSKADEAALESLSVSLGLREASGKGKKEAKFPSDILPCYVEVDGSKIVFGKNARQNDVLTFLLETAKDHLWLHPNNESGAHVSIKCDKPSDRMIRLAQEIAVLSTGKRSGSVMMARRGDVTKGPKQGSVSVRKFSIHELRSVSSEAIALYERAKKVDYLK